MGTHPIFESDFDCLTGMRPTAAARSVKALVEANASHNVYTNGITSINLPAAGKAARLTVSLNAGARHEAADGVGGASFARNCIGLSNYRNTGFLQNRMVNAMGASLTTSGTRERTLINLVAGPKAIEELALDVIVPSIQQPLFHKWETNLAWDAAKAQAECPVMEAFHSASFKGGLANQLAFKGGYGDEAVFHYSEREEELANLARAFHTNNYGIDGATVVGTNVSDEFLAQFVQALQTTSLANSSDSASGFHPGQVRVRRNGGSVAVVGVDVTNADPAAAAVVAASVGGDIVSYSDVSVLKFASRSPAELAAKLESLAAVDVASASANAALAQALVLGSGDAAAVNAVATGAAMADVGSAHADDVQALASAIAAAPKSMAVLGDVHAFPQNTEI